MEGDVEEIVIRQEQVVEIMKSRTKIVEEDVEGDVEEVVTCQNKGCGRGCGRGRDL